MNNLKKSHDLVRQNEKVVKKSQKHDVNLRKNSTLYFQIGLIVCLLGSYTALEMVFATSGDFSNVVEPEDITIYEADPKRYKLEEKSVEKLPEPKRAEPKNPKYEAGDNETKEEQFVEKIVEPVENGTEKTETMDEQSLIVAPPEKTPTIFSVQKVPVYPGCEKATNNDARRKCMSDKLSKLIQNKFNPDLGAQLGLQGRQKIWVKFKINKQGEVEILNTRSPHQDLDKEAIRVVEKIPTMTPGMNDDRPVEVSYMLPINLNIQN